MNRLALSAGVGQQSPQLEAGRIHDFPVKDKGLAELPNAFVLKCTRHHSYPSSNSTTLPTCYPLSVFLKHICNSNITQVHESEHFLAPSDNVEWIILQKTRLGGVIVGVLHSLSYCASLASRHAPLRVQRDNLTLCE